jgi:3-methyladenine DNA glycosylase AlkD
MSSIIREELRRLAEPEHGERLQSFFKTGKGEYGEGDVFLGVRVPEQRRIAKKYREIPIEQIVTLLHSRFHEERLTALFILVNQFQRGDEQKKEKIVNIYLKNTKYINNWDLVDSSAHKILGEWLKNRPKEILYELANSKNIWERRISIISTFALIGEGDFKDALKLVETLKNDEHDLIHKATGWVLREIGKKDLQELIRFLDNHYNEMPRTMLRYSIEKLPKEKRKHYLSKK